MGVGNSLNMNESGFQSFDGTSVFNGRTITAGSRTTVINGNGTNGNPTVSSESPDLALIQTSTVTSSTASVEFTSLSSAYTTYLLVVSNAKPVGFNVNLEMLYSIDGGSSYLVTGYLSNDWVFTNSGASGSNAVTDRILLSTGTSNAVSYNISGKTWSYNLMTTGTSPTAVGSGFYSAAAGDSRYSIIWGTNTTTTAVNAIKVRFNSGNIALGKFSLYGLRQ